MAAGGKGSRQRKAVVSDEVVASNWELAFGRKDKQAKPENTPSLDTDKGPKDSQGSTKQK